MLSSSRSQTIGNQSSSRRNSRTRYHRTPHEGETSRMMGVLVKGLPSTKKVDKLNEFMASDKAPHKRVAEATPWCEATFNTHYYQWYSGKETTGEGVYISSREDIEKFSECINGKRIDKKHGKISTCVVPICFNCHFPLDCEDTPPRTTFNLEKASTLDRNVCEMCLPSPITCCCCDSILSDEGILEYVRSSRGLYACHSCREDSSAQEKWRYNEENKLISATSSSYVEELHLSDEAIEREKELMGGVPPKPQDTTPFIETFRIQDLIDPKSRDYWPFGMNAQQYLEHKELMKFNNPIQETPDESWREVEVTEEVLSTYTQDLQSAYKKFNYSDKDRGSLPAEIVSNDCKYRLIEGYHSFTCDSPVCQAVFQYHQASDAGAFSALVATGIPMFTTRKGDIHGTPREAGFGHERCIACVSKVIPENFRISDICTFYYPWNSVMTSRYTTDKKL